MCFKDHFDIKSPVAFELKDSESLGLEPMDVALLDARGNRYLGCYSVGDDTDPETADVVPHVFVSVFSDTVIYMHKIVASKLASSEKTL